MIRHMLGTTSHLKYLFNTRVMFVSIDRHWKGVYLHIFPNKCHRLYWADGRLQHDSYPKAPSWIRREWDLEHLQYCLRKKS